MIEIASTVKSQSEKISGLIENQIIRKLQVVFEQSEIKLQELDQENLQLKQIILEKDKFIQNLKKKENDLQLKIKAGIIELETLNQNYRVLLADSQKKNKLIASMRAFNN